ncbi:MAG: tetratricopeptide repeat protein, partial [Candidatus Obscuribacterales bacterium]|nr:tetratricopeptide repeat protein [Candidatus Obscuribacterales bacterium]
PLMEAQSFAQSKDRERQVSTNSQAAQQPSFQKPAESVPAPPLTGQPPVPQPLLEADPNTPARQAEQSSKPVQSVQSVQSVQQIPAPAQGGVQKTESEFSFPSNQTPSQANQAKPISAPVHPPAAMVPGPLADNLTAPDSTFVQRSRQTELPQVVSSMPGPYLVSAENDFQDATLANQAPTGQGPAILGKDVQAGSLSEEFTGHGRRSTLLDPTGRYDDEQKDAMPQKVNRRTIEEEKREWPFRKMVALLVVIGIAIGAGSYQVSQLFAPQKKTGTTKSAVADGSGKLRLESQSQLQENEVDGKKPVGLPLAKWQKAFERGLNFEKEKDFDSALKEYSEALTLEPGRPEILHSRGRVLTGLKQYVRSIGDFTKALKTSSNQNEVLIDRAAAYIFNGDVNRAIRDYNRILKNDPAYVKAVYGRGLAYMKLKQYDDAIGDLERVTKMLPSFANAYKQEGLALSIQGKKEEAFTVFSQGIERIINNPELFYERALVNYDLGKQEDSIADFSKAIELSPDKKEYYNDRGYVYLHLRRFSEAALDFEHCLSIDPGYSIARDNLEKARDSRVR